MKVDFQDSNVPIKMWTDGVPVEEEARQQLVNTANMPFIHKHIAVMPDVHLGRGATIGSVIPTKGAIIPAAVGVDIGCGMMAAKTTLSAEDLPDDLSDLRSDIESRIPVGRNDFGDDITRPAEKIWYSRFKKDFEDITYRHKGIADRKRKSPARQIGTLGGGNHFVEVCLDEEGSVWIMLHSGSRGIGNRIGTYFISQAKEEMERHFIHLPDKDLSYIVEGSEIFDDYVKAVGWAQDYALVNRQHMMAAVHVSLRKYTKPYLVREEAINCHHNYIEKENHFGDNIWITRKGAVRARKGDLGIIPGSMGAKSFIVEGLENDQSFHSCSHGAGRVMSRTKAKELINLEDHIAATDGVECRKDEGVIDESPAAYKDIDAVMEAQSDLVSIKHTLKQVLCVKG